MSKKSFLQLLEAAVQALLNAQKVDASVITDECGNVAIRKAPWNDTETIAEEPKVIPGRMVCSGGECGDKLDFKPYAQSGAVIYGDYPYLAWCPPYFAAACVRLLLFPEGNAQVGYSEISLQRGDGDEGQG